MATFRERPRQEATIHYSNPSSKREYAAAGYSTRDDVYTAGVAVWPTTDTIGAVARFIESVKITEVGGGCWDVVVNYSKNPNQYELSGDIGTQSTKFLQSLETINSYTTDFSPGLPPDHKKAINVADDKIEGVDVEISKYDFSITKKLSFTTMGGVYLETIRNMTPSVNDNDYTIYWKTQTQTFKKGSLKFRGATWKQTQDDTLDITYRFQYSRGISAADNITIGNSDPIVKEGHQYLWVQQGKIPVSGVSVARPLYVYIERVYEYANFLDLAL